MLGCLLAAFIVLGSFFPFSYFTSFLLISLVVLGLCDCTQASSSCGAGFSLAASLAGAGSRCGLSGGSGLGLGLAASGAQRLAEAGAGAQWSHGCGVFEGRTRSLCCLCWREPLAPLNRQRGPFLLSLGPRSVAVRQVSLSVLFGFLFQYLLYINIGFCLLVTLRK